MPLTKGDVDDSTSGTVFAFDFGTRRIGVAVGETGSGLAHPLTTISGEGNEARFAAIAALLHEWRPTLLVVGFPLTVDGREHEMSARCQRFARQLHGRFGLPVRLVDERYTSAVAEAELRKAGISVRGHKGRIDAMAAQQILQSFLDSQRGAN